MVVGHAVTEQCLLTTTTRHFGLLSSGIHWWWAVTHASTMREADIRYTPTDCFETFVQPALTDAIATHGAQPA